MPNDRIELPIQGLWNYQGLGEYRAGNLKQGVAVRLVLDPNNLHDSNAVEVRLVKPECKLGYVPRTQAIWVSNFIRNGNSLPASVIKIGISKKYNHEHLYCIIVVDLPSGSNPNPRYLNDIKRDLHSHDKRCGIYEIYCQTTKKRYIGSSKDIGNRLRQHFDLLTQNRHHSEKLQSDWNQHLHSSFKFKIVKEVSDIDILYEEEQFYIDKYDSFYNGYNASPLANNKLIGRGLRHKKSPETMQQNFPGYRFNHREVDSRPGSLSDVSIVRKNREERRRQREKERRQREEQPKQQEEQYSQRWEEERRRRESEAKKQQKIASQWWRWPLMPFAAFFGSLIGSYLLGLILFRGDYSEDGWYYLYVMPVISYAMFGCLYAQISHAVAPHSKNIADIIMVTLFGGGLLGLIFVTWNLDIARSEAIRTTIGGIAAIIAAILQLFASRI